MSKKELIVRINEKCPYCNTDEIHNIIYGDEEWSLASDKTPIIEHYILCRACDAEWIETYKLSDVDKMEED